MNIIQNDQKAISLKNKCVEFLFAYQQRNVDRMLRCCAMDGDIDFTPLGEQGKGKIHVLGKAIWTGLIDAFPDIDNTLDAAVADGEDQVRCQVLISGTQQKEFAGIPSAGMHFDSDHIFIFRIGPDQLIESIQITWDHADFTKQLSA